MSDRQDFWKRLADVNAGLLGCEPDWRLVPMSHYPDEDANALWFITAQGTELVDAVANGSKRAVHAIADADNKLYARIEGQLSVSHDTEKLDEIWSTVASSWFEGGKRDNDVRLLQFKIATAEVWVTTGGLGFLYETAKANLTKAKPDMGEHFTVQF